MRTPKPRPARKGQSLVNYVRFKKGLRTYHTKIGDEPRSISSHIVENYIYWMSDKEFQEAIEYNG